MKIYTKTGDKGKTKLVGGATVSKADARLEAYGTVDELNSAVGFCRSFLGDFKNSGDSNSRSANLHSPTEKLKETDQQLKKIQNWLFDLGSQLACDKEDLRLKLPQLHPKMTESLEIWIDQMSSTLPLLTEFILPTGHPLSASFHLARTICRRCERATVRLLETTESALAEMQSHEVAISECAPINSAQGRTTYLQAVILLNRLSDYFFVCARYSQAQMGLKDEAWQKSDFP